MSSSTSPPLSLQPMDQTAQGRDLERLHLIVLADGTLRVSRATHFRRMRLFRRQYIDCRTADEVVSQAPLAATSDAARRILVTAPVQRAPHGCPSLPSIQSPSRAATTIDRRHADLKLGAIS